MAKRRGNSRRGSVRRSRRTGYRSKGRVRSRSNAPHTVRIVVETGQGQPGGPVTPEALKASFMSPVGVKSNKKGAFT